MINAELIKLARQITAHAAAQTLVRDAFLSAHCEIQATLDRLTHHAVDFLGKVPDQVTAADVEEARQLMRDLQKISDKAFHEGEYAA